MENKVQRPTHIDRFTGATLVFVAVIFVVSLVFYVRERAANYPERFVFEIPPATQAVEFTDEDGASISLRDLNGSYSLVAFGYTHCPDVCPLTLSDFYRVKRQLGEDGDKLNYVLISVDGARDTPQAMKNFVTRFDEDFIGMTTADDSRLSTVADAFDVYYSRIYLDNSAIEYICDHTATVFLLGPDGNVVNTFPFGVHPDDMARDIAPRL
ncbi:MAG: SCO family protein [Chloroflexota bacterium]